MNHKIKCWPVYFEAIVSGEKTFEVRKDDRNYAVGDVLRIHEWDDERQKFTGREEDRTVVYKMNGGKFGVQEGYCVLGIQETTA